MLLSPVVDVVAYSLIPTVTLNAFDDKLLVPLPPNTVSDDQDYEDERANLRLL
jgi:hypothetical protein